MKTVDFTDLRLNRDLGFVIDINLLTEPGDSGFDVNVSVPQTNVYLN